MVFGEASENRRAEAGAQDADRETAFRCSPTPRPPRFCCLPPLTNHTLDASPYHPKACASAAAAAFFPLWRGSSLGFNKSIFILTNIPQAHDTHSTRTLSRDALLRFMTRFSLFSSSS